MKNIHILPTNKPSRISDCHDGKLYLDDVRYLKSYQNIYITNEVEIKKDDYVVAYGVVIKVMMSDNDRLFFVNGTKAKREDCKKIILTTDQDLIKDGVQAIDDEFLEWFVKNPSCEEVEVYKFISGIYFCTNPMIPNEEPKQETLEEDLRQLFKNNFDCYADVDSDNVIMAMTEDCFIETFKEWQQQQNKNLYSDEDMTKYALYILNNTVITPKEWFEQFKKK